MLEISGIQFLEFAWYSLLILMTNIAIGRVDQIDQCIKDVDLCALNLFIV